MNDLKIMLSILLLLLLMIFIWYFAQVLVLICYVIIIIMLVDSLIKAKKEADKWSKVNKNSKKLEKL